MVFRIVDLEPESLEQFRRPDARAPGDLAVRIGPPRGAGRGVEKMDTTYFTRLVLNWR